MKWISSALGIWMISWSCSAQTINFIPSFKGDVLVLEEPYALVDGSTLEVSTFKFYVGHFAFYHNGVQELLNEAYHLVDVSDTMSLTVDLSSGEPVVFDSMAFVLGVDSLTNVSGAFGGDLDPTKGMYWTWNSGYINMKLEGTSPISPAKKNAFQFHLGGYLQPYATVEQIGFHVTPRRTLDLHVDLARFFSKVEIATEHTVMSPGENAVLLSKLAASMFSVIAK